MVIAVVLTSTRSVNTYACTHTTRFKDLLPEQHQPVLPADVGYPGKRVVYVCACAYYSVCVDFLMDHMYCLGWLAFCSERE